MIVPVKNVTRFTASDFPVAAIIEPVLNEAGYELPDDYEGTSVNPFLVEAFIQAVKTNKLDVFGVASVDTAEPSKAVGLRFGFPEKIWKDIQNRIPLGEMLDAQYYTATVGMAITGKDFEYFIRPVQMRMVLAYAEENGMTRFLSSEKLNDVVVKLAMISRAKPNLAVSAPGAWNYVVSGLVLTFNQEEVNELISWSSLPEHYSYVIKMRKMGFETIQEIMENINSVPESYLNQMMKD